MLGRLGCSTGIELYAIVKSKSVSELQEMKFVAEKSDILIEIIIIIRAQSLWER